MRSQNVIIFSSGKNKCVAHEIARGLDGDVCKAVVWDEFFNKIYGVEYTLTKSYALFPFLIKKIPSFDYAIIIAGDDDRMRKNGEDGHEYVTARDNVIFELGLCAMALGEKRVIIVHHKDVRLIDDLRGYGEEAQRRICEGEIGLEDTVLSSSNVQLKTFDYGAESDFGEIARQIGDYIRETCDSYSPVVVGAACSTALGYRDNFLMAFSKAVEKTDFTVPGSAMCGGKDAPWLRDVLSHPENVELHILLPTIEATERYPQLLSQTRTFLGEHLYGQYGTLSDCKIRDAARTIGFCCKVVDSRLIVFDLPTTLLASQRTAQKVLDIKVDDAIEKDHLSRILATEIDLFRHTLTQFLLPGVNGTYHVTVADVNASTNKIFIEEIAFDELIDNLTIPWLSYDRNPIHEGVYDGRK